MPNAISTNLLALNARRNLEKNSGGQTAALQRLSSGKRINSAKDDAAGLAVSERMTSQIRGQEVAQRNTNDAISLAQTAEGALQTSGDILQRIREITIQSLNSTNSASDRQALNTEANQLLQELQQKAISTNFNGIMLLDGSKPALEFQGGANENETISLSIENFQTNSYGTYKIGGLAASHNDTFGDLVPGSVADSRLLSANMAFTFNSNGNIDISSINGEKTVSYTASDSAEAVAEKINSSDSGIQAKASTDVFLGPDIINSAIGFRQGHKYSFDLATNFSLPTPATASPPPYVTVSFSVGGELDSNTFLGVPGKPVDSPEQLQEAANAFNSASSKTGFTARITKAENGGYAIQLSNPTGKDLLFSPRIGGLSICDASILDGDTTTSGGLVFFGGGTEQSPNDWTFFGNGILSRGKIELESAKPFSIDSSSTDFFKTIGVKNAQLQSVDQINIGTYEASQRTLSICDGALSTINSQRAKLGAMQSRFDANNQNLSVSTENLTASRSRIVDTDFASETAELTRQQILQQAGTAMLAQANLLPQQVLSLLKD